MPLESSSVHRVDYHLGDQVVDCGQKNKGPIWDPLWCSWRMGWGIKFQGIGVKWGEGKLFEWN